MCPKRVVPLYVCTFFPHSASLLLSRQKLPSLPTFVKMPSLHKKEWLFVRETLQSDLEFLDPCLHVADCEKTKSKGEKKGNSGKTKKLDKIKNGEANVQTGATSCSLVRQTRRVPPSVLHKWDVAERSNMRIYTNCPWLSLAMGTV